MPTYTRRGRTFTYGNTPQQGINSLPVASVEPPPPISFERQIPVNAAYQRLMQYGAQSDADKGALQRNLATNIDTSQKNRFRSLLNSRQGMADRGTLNSGVALNRQQELNTGFDTTDNQMTQNYDRSLADMARQKLGLEQAYKDAQMQGAQFTIEDQAAARDAQIQAQEAAAERQRLAALQAQQQADMVAALQAQAQASMQQTQPYNAPIANEPVSASPVDNSYAQQALAYAAALARNKKVAPKAPIIKLGARGPQ